MIFLLGTLCFKLGTFDGKPVGKKRYYILCATIWIPMNLFFAARRSNRCASGNCHRISGSDVWTNERAARRTEMEMHAQFYLPPDNVPGITPTEAGAQGYYAMNI